MVVKTSHTEDYLWDKGEVKERHPNCLRCTQTLQAAVSKAEALPKALRIVVLEGDFRKGFLGTGLLKQNLKKKKEPSTGSFLQSWAV